MIIRHFNTVNTVESGYSRTWRLSIILIRWSPGIHSENSVMLPRYVFEKAFIPAWTLEETESVLLNLGKCWKPKGTNKPRMQKRGDKEKPSQREGAHFKMLSCVINVRSLVSSIYSRCWSRPPVRSNRLLTSKRFYTPPSRTIIRGPADECGTRA